MFGVWGVTQPSQSTGAGNGARPRLSSINHANTSFLFLAMPPIKSQEIAAAKAKLAPLPVPTSSK
jgi:hypothetical protein